MALVTRKYIENYIATHSQEQVAQFVGRALVVIFRNQTDAERQSNVTNQDNGVGFTGADAHSGCLTAKSFLKRGTLQDWQIEKWTKRNRKGTMRLAKYWRQLDAEAQRKAREARLTRRQSEEAREQAIEDQHQARKRQGPEWASRVQEKAEFAELERRQEEAAYAAEAEEEDRLAAFLEKLQNA